MFVTRHHAEHVLNHEYLTSARIMHSVHISDISKYQNKGIMYVCGDFNSRCGDLDDFIRGFDCIPDRDILDFNLNKYGEMLIEFLINTSMCLLNGRGGGGGK